MTTPLERDLHAYADGRLDEAEAARVAAWLAEQPEAAARVLDWQRQNEQLHFAFDPVLDEAVPDRWLTRIADARRQRARPLAIAAAWIALGGVLGYLVGTLPTGASLAPAPTSSIGASPLPRQAAIAHVIYSPEVRHPVEVGADQEAHLVQWLSKRLGQPIRIPALGERGFALVGGRLLPGDRGPVAQFMYENPQGTRLTLYVSPPAENDRESAFRFADEAGVGVFYWVDPRFAYALAGDLDRDTLLAIAETAYHQLDRAGAGL
ncbi:MAG TPA: anti-sigma factor [Rhodocyclaceae bacterium]